MARALEDLRTPAGDGGRGLLDKLEEHASRVAGAVAGGDSDEHELLEASGAGATRTTLDEAEGGEDPFREASGVVLHGATDTICGKPIFLASSTLFAAGSSSILPAGHVELRRVARLLLRHASRTFVVAAHVPLADPTAAETLSKERAQAIASWLKVWPGLEGTQMVPLGVGDRDGLVGDSSKGTVLRLNDRVEIGLSCGDGSTPEGPTPKRPKRRKEPVR